MMNARNAVLIAALASLSCSGDDGSPAAASIAAEPLATALQSALSLWASDPSHVGVSAAVIVEGADAWVGAAGLSSEGVPLEPHMMISIASITKTVTGAVILQLAEEGLLGLDDPISNWLGEMENVPGAITIRQLLNHTNGLSNYTLHPDYGPAVTEDYMRRFTPAEVIQRFVDPPRFSPGERTEYTNTAFLLLGMIAEAATGSSIAQQYRERFWEPLGLDEVFLPHAEEVRGVVAGGWVGEAGQPLNEVDPLELVSLYTTRWSAFGLIASSRNVARWGEALFTGRILGEEMMSEMLMFVPDAQRIPVESGVGLGIRRYDYFDGEQWGHSGASSEGSSLLLFEVGSQITVVVAMNQSPASHGSSQFALGAELLEITRESRGQ